MIYDQPIHNFPGSIWFEEISSEDFNDPDPAATPVQAPAIPAETGGERLAPVVSGPFGFDEEQPDASPLINPYSID